MISEVDLAWAAGFLDGEGVLQVWKKGSPLKNGRGYVKYTNVVVRGYNMDLEPLNKLKALFGGSVRPRWARYKGPQDKDGKLHLGYLGCYVWSIANLKALKAATLLLPYLTVKREGALKIVEYYRPPEHF